MTEFNIEEYLNSLPDNVDTIEVFDKNLKYLPDLSRFKSLMFLYCYKNHLTLLPTLPEKLVYLNCCCNKLISLPILPKNLRILYCNNNQLISLPVLPENLKILYCVNNNLRLIPILPENLKELFCFNNNLPSLPVLPENLERLNCRHNNLTSFPLLNNNLKTIYFNNNPIYEIINYDYYIYRSKFNMLKKNIETLYNFRYLYYCLKYKEKLWKIRESIIKKKYHPSYLDNLTEDDNLDEKLEKW